MRTFARRWMAALMVLAMGGMTVPAQAQSTAELEAEMARLAREEAALRASATRWAVVGGLTGAVGVLFLGAATVGSGGLVGAAAFAVGGIVLTGTGVHGAGRIEERTREADAIARRIFDLRLELSRREGANIPRDARTARPPRRTEENRDAGGGAAGAGTARD